MCVWTCSVQDNPLYSDIHVPTGSHSRAVLFYSWDLLIHYQAWLETCEPICFFLSSAGGWSVPLPMWAIVVFQTACRGRASAEILISFFFACFFWCSSPVWWFFASRLGNIHHVFPLFASLFPFWTFGPNGGAFPVFCKLILMQFLHSFCSSLSGKKWFSLLIKIYRHH